MRTSSLIVFFALAACGGNSTCDGGTGGGSSSLGGGNASMGGGAVDADPAHQAGDGISRDTVTVDAAAADRYTWTDSKGRTRTATLKRQGTGNGGFAIELTWQEPDGASLRTVTANGRGGGEMGFGYFVAHERYRTFDDGSQGTIASLHGEDDSPLGVGFSVTGSHSDITAASTFVTHTFVSSYPKWGTVAPMDDVDAMTPKAAAAHRKFELPVTLQWTFQKGTDFPRIDVKLDLSSAQAGQLAFDVRGPYGVLEFADGDSGATLNNVQWGDSAYHFTTQAPAAGDLLTTAGWDWSVPIGTSRPYHALVARHSGSNLLYEIGLLQLKLGTDTGLVFGGYSENLGKTKAATGHALLSGEFGEGEWPFQSANYSGVSAASPTTGKKFAWGSSSLYGSKTTSQFLNGMTQIPIVPFPADSMLRYRTCLVLGVSTFTDASRVTLTRAAAASATPACATASPL